MASPAALDRGPESHHGAAMLAVANVVLPVFGIILAGYLFAILGVG
jgi:hypothetical protein